MILYMPTLVYSENECVKNHGKEMSALGKKAMIVTGKKSSRANGSLSDVIEALEANDTEYVVFDDIEENPSVETVMRARDEAVAAGVDFVIGIGGGSPLDASKAIAMMIANKDKDESVLYESVKLPYVPVACVPTTCGTGSEVTPYAILTLHKQRTKKSISHKIYPAMALIDGKYLKTASKQNIINTSVDALAHLVESFLNTNSNELNRIYSRQGLRMWSQIKDKLIGDDVTEEDYALLMHASMVAGMAITHTGTSLPHALSYSVTYEMNVPHGKAVGIFLGGYVELYKNKEETKEILDILGFDDAKSFKEYLTNVLGEVEITDELKKENAKAVFANKAKLKNYPFEVTEEEILGLL